MTLSETHRDVAPLSDTKSEARRRRADGNGEGRARVPPPPVMHSTPWPAWMASPLLDENLGRHCPARVDADIPPNVSLAHDQGRYYGRSTAGCILMPPRKGVRTVDEPCPCSLSFDSVGCARGSRCGASPSENPCFDRRKNKYPFVNHLLTIRANSCESLPSK
jgi:hypothetical protein